MSRSLALIIAACLFLGGTTVPVQGEKLGLGSREQEAPPEPPRTETKVQYTRYPVWIFARREDLGKAAGEVPREHRTLIEVGSRVTTLEEAAGPNGGEAGRWARIQLPDGTEHWVAARHLVDRFIVISRRDVLCYDQPDATFATTIFLQPGDFGYFLDEQEGWIKAAFHAYRPREPEGEPLWVGERWIKSSGFTDDVLAAKEAYYLYRARRELRRDAQGAAVEHLLRADGINVLEDTEITPVIRSLLAELTAQTVEAPGG